MASKLKRINELILLNFSSVGARVMVQGLKAPTTIVEDLGPIPSIHVAAHECL